MQSNSRMSRSSAERLPFAELDLNERQRAPAPAQLTSSCHTPSSSRAPLCSLVTTNLLSHHVPKSESVSSNTSSSSVYTMPESPALWFSPVVTPGSSTFSSPAHSRTPSRKGKEKALDEGYDSAASARHGLAIDMNFPRLSPVNQDLESGNTSTYMDSPVLTHTRSMTLTSAREETAHSLFKRRSRFVRPVETPPLLGTTFEVPALPSVASQYSSTSSSSSASPSTTRIPSWNLSKKRTQTFDHLDRLRIASSPNRRRTDHNTINFGPTSRSMRPVVGVLTIIFLAIFFFLLGSFNTSVSSEGAHANRHSFDTRFTSIQSQNVIKSSTWSLPLLRYFPKSQSIASASSTRTRDEPHRDTLVLYRILGNDLPPRHVPGQTLRNLRFMLEQESHFTSLEALADAGLVGIRRVEKYYVLNRISSEELLEAMRNLLAEFAIPQNKMLTIPFEWDEYARRQIRWDHGVAEVSGVWGIGRAGERLMELRTHENETLAAVAQAENLNSKIEGKIQNLQGIGKLRAIDFTYHDKNLYAINNNGGRNFALEHGRSLPYSRWVLPLDGNCFFTPSALLTLVHNLEELGEGDSHKSHVIIPMARLLDNVALLANNTDYNFAQDVDKQKSLLDHIVHSSPRAPEEPQIGFRFDSPESFQLNMRYGRRSKLELLWRLGAVPRSRSLDSRTLPWEQSDREHLTSESFASIRSHVKDVSQVGFIKAGWVYRLFSGDPNQETFTPEANALRNMNRIRGIVGFLERLDEKLARGQLCSDSSACGFSQSLTWTWDRSALDVMKARYRAGASEAVKHVKSLVHSAKEIERNLNQQPLPLAEDIATLALASFFTGTRPYAEIAAQLAHDLILNSPAETASSPSATLLGDGAGYTFPYLSLGRSRSPVWMAPSTKARAVTGVSSLPLLLDALRLVESTVPGSLSKAQITTVLSQHLVHLLSNKEQLSASALPMSAAAANQYDIEVANLAAYLDDVRLLQRVRDRAVLRTESMALDPDLVKGFRNLRMFREIDAADDSNLV